MCKMIYEMIESEFEGTQEHSILRGNSITTKLEVLFCSMIKKIKKMKQYINKSI